MRRFGNEYLGWLLGAIFLLAAPLSAAGPEERPTIGKKTTGLQKMEGFLTLYLDRKQGRVWLELPAAGEEGLLFEAIYLEGLQRGLGSNPVGLDRGQMGDARLLRVRRLGPKVLFEEPNLKYRALGAPAAERLATEDSFATSVLWAGKIAAEDPDGRSLLDLTPFLLRDAHGVVAKLAETDQGKFQLDPQRSAVDFGACHVFPDNIELESVLTFAGDAPGDHVESTAPTATAVSLVQHQSLVRLPDDGYRPRRFDPRIAFWDVDFLDYATPLGEPIRRQWIGRHRLQKTDPKAARSAVSEPIVYYLDPGAPEPVASALLDGARWWAKAFEAAGFIDAFRVEVLPEGAHPLDVRYNVIQWVHRSTRGWSYGNGITDPRTGEIIKGHVSLGSLRVRQDILLFEGLAGAVKTGSGAPDDPIQLALARIRQLSAHEVGHTLGLAHNFAASTYDGRASVMDYPAPWVRVVNGELSFAAAYGVGVGSWDVHCIRYGYSQFPPGADEAAELEAIVRQGLAEGLLFVADDDARPEGSADPRGNLWDNGANAVTSLQEVLAVRRLALSRFGVGNVAVGTPLAHLEEVLAPLYFHHRFQLEAAVKAIGGLETNYALRGDGQTATRPVAGGQQRRALEVILGILQPEALDLPESALELLASRPFESEENREMFSTSTWPAFDALGAAATAADHVIRNLLHSARLGRLIDFHRRDPDLPGPEEVLGALADRVFPAEPPSSPRQAEIHRVVQRTAVERLMAAASEIELPPGLRAWLEWTLERAVGRLQLSGGANETAAQVHRRALVTDIERFLNRGWRDTSHPYATPEPPPGSPIGMPEQEGCLAAH